MMGGSEEVKGWKSGRERQTKGDGPVDIYGSGCGGEEEQEGWYVSLSRCVPEFGGGYGQEVRCVVIDYVECI
jgi:hypothetical protein